VWGPLARCCGQQGTTAIEGDVTDRGVGGGKAQRENLPRLKNVTRETQTDANGHYQFRPYSLDRTSFMWKRRGSGNRTHKMTRWWYDSASEH